MRKGPFKANKKKLTGWPEAAAGHRNPALGLSPPYFDEKAVGKTQKAVGKPKKLLEKLFFFKAVEFSR